MANLQRWPRDQRDKWRNHAIIVWSCHVLLSFAARFALFLRVALFNRQAWYLHLNKWHFSSFSSWQHWKGNTLGNGFYSLFFFIVGYCSRDSFDWTSCGCCGNYHHELSVCAKLATCQSGGVACHRSGLQTSSAQKKEHDEKRAVMIVIWLWKFSHFSFCF